MVTAVEAQSDVTFDPDTFNPHYSYYDAKDQIHTVWMLDGVTAYNQIRAAEQAGVRGTALVAAWHGGSFALVHLGFNQSHR